jgi:lysophospholipase L1-like esterase
MQVRRLVGWVGCAGMAILVVTATALSQNPAHPTPAPRARASAEPHTSPPQSPPADAAVPGPWTVVGLGDSVVSGSHCDCAPFITRYGTLVAQATHRSTTVRNLGVGGSTTADLLKSLQPGGTATRRLLGADIVTVTIGANDMAFARSEWQQDGCVTCFAKVSATVKANLGKILRLIRSDARRDPVEVLVTTYWNVFEEAVNDPQTPAYAAMADLATSSANNAICAAAARGNAECVDLYRPFKGDGSVDATPLLAADGDHPDAAGHQLIASRLAAYGWRELGVPPASG